jgi:hypothetical protein
MEFLSHRYIATAVAFLIPLSLFLVGEIRLQLAFAFVGVFFLGVLVGKDQQEIKEKKRREKEREEAARFRKEQAEIT